MEPSPTRSATHSLSSPVLLAEDTLLIPVEELEEDVRERLECEPDDVAVSRPGSRKPSSIVDADTAGLLEVFRQPRTIVEAVILFSKRRGLDPEETLSGAYPVLRRLLGSRFLVTEGEGSETADLDGLAGARVGDFEVADLLHTLEDTAVYLARDDDGRPAALKIQRGDAAGIGDCLAHEAAVLSHLDGRVAPRLLAKGEIDGRRYLALEWCSGVKPDRVAAECRELTRAERSGRLLALCRRIAAAYADLHAAGVLHGDVHPDNILVDRDGGVRLVDFGLARLRFEAPGGSRTDVTGGVPFFYDPEHAAAMRAAAPPPRPSAAAEQYALGAVLYLVATGAHYLDFRLERDEMLRQIVEDEPWSFERRGAAPWPELEAVLARALAKRPTDRYPDLATLAAALEAIDEGAAESADSAAAAPSPAAPALARALEETLAASALGGPMLEAGLTPAPTASVNFGAAGIGYGLYRIAGRLGDAATLAAAQAWAWRASTDITETEGFYNPDNELPPERLGSASPYHTPSGVWATRALVARALGDPAAQSRAIEGFLGAVEEAPEELDVTLGRAGIVLAGALLLDALPPGGLIAREPLAQAGRAQLAVIGERVGEMRPIGEAELDNLGVAHGWGGLLYAALQWSRASGDPHPQWLERRAEELAAQALPAGRGCRWPWQLGRDSQGRRPFMSGWCNGSAGHVLLWTLAARELASERYLDLAIGAGWDAWDAPGSTASLCCGLIGRSWAMLSLYRHTGETAWLGRARELARRCALDGVFEPEYPHSLYKGRFGLAVLAADLERPEESALPFFEEEGWPRSDGLT